MDTASQTDQMTRVQTKRLPIIVLPTALGAALEQFMSGFYEEHGIPPTQAVIVREALAEYLEARGYPSSGDIHPVRGGSHPK
jgi:hypothetical protein